MPPIVSCPFLLFIIFFIIFYLFKTARRRGAVCNGALPFPYVLQMKALWNKSYYRTFYNVPRCFFAFLKPFSFFLWFRSHSPLWPCWPCSSWFGLGFLLAYYWIGFAAYNMEFLFWFLTSYRPSLNWRPPKSGTSPGPPSCPCHRFPSFSFLFPSAYSSHCALVPNVTGFFHCLFC